ncbi:MAG: nickel ABC transporter substrate-binding protein [Deltaproteobacteria bacterium]|jgi:nickel transport system substrate-binding protein|nr:nickel ABC transporter substrate-binding protein [Deltaproteobacteria bacterium]
MRSSIPLKATLAALSCLVFLAALGCSGENAPDSSAPSSGQAGQASQADQAAPAETAASDNTITFAVSTDLGDFNPHLYNATQYAQDFLYEGLVYQTNGKVEPCLAESWEISEDGLEIVFHLRKGAKFSDGSAFDAHNVKKNFDAIMSHPEDYNWMGLVNSMDRYEVVNDDTFKVIFKEPYYAALQEFSSVRPFRMLGDAGFMEDGSTAGGIKAPIGTGLWKLDKHVDGEYSVFSKNPHYWGQAPKLDGFTARVIPKGETAVTSLKVGEIDLIYDLFESELMTISNYEIFENDENYRTFISGPMFTRIMTVNTTRAPLNDLNVRKAIALALDREAMVQNVFHKTEPVATGFMWEGIPYCDVGLKPIPYDQAQAKALLDQAGWTIKEGQSVRSKDGKPFEIGLYYDSINVIHRAFAQIIQAQLNEVGIKVNLTGEESAAYVNRGVAGDFDLTFSLSWGEPYDPHSTLNSLATHSGTTDFTGVAGLPNYDELAQQIKDVLHVTSHEKRQEMYKEILTTIHEGYGLIALSYKTNRAAAKKNVENVEFHFSYDMPLGHTVKR